MTDRQCTNVPTSIKSLLFLAKTQPPKIMIKTTYLVVGGLEEIVSEEQFQRISLVNFYRNSFHISIFIFIKNLGTIISNFYLTRR